MQLPSVMPEQKCQKQVLFLDSLSYGQHLGGLVGSIFYVFVHKRRHRQQNIFGQILKGAEIADHLRIICGYLKYLVHAAVESGIAWNLWWQKD